MLFNINKSRLEYWPIGSIYMSVIYHHPTDLFGGTWELISGRFLVGHGSNGNDLEVLAGDTGGEAKHTLTVNEMPEHSHSLGNIATGGEAGITWVQVSNGAGAWQGAGYERRTVGIGGSQPHNNLPPYLAVYIWKRTA